MKCAISQTFTITTLKSENSMSRTERDKIYSEILKGKRYGLKDYQIYEKLDISKRTYYRYKKTLKDGITPAFRFWRELSKLIRYVYNERVQEPINISVLFPKLKKPTFCQIHNIRLEVFKYRRDELLKAILPKKFRKYSRSSMKLFQSEREFDISNNELYTINIPKFSGKKTSKKYIKMIERLYKLVELEILKNFTIHIGFTDTNDFDILEKKDEIFLFVPKPTLRACISRLPKDFTDKLYKIIEKNHSVEISEPDKTRNELYESKAWKYYPKFMKIIDNNRHWQYYPIIDEVKKLKQ